MKIIYTNKGQEIFVDDEDYEDLTKHTWFISKKGYAVRNVAHPTEKGKWVIEGMHRRIMGLEYGNTLKVDHRDHCKVNNQRINLRVCTNSQNLFNRGANRNNTSGFKGVNQDKNSGRWVAEIWKNGKKKSLGHFDTAESAHEAYCKAAIEIHGEFANFGDAKKAA